MASCRLLGRAGGQLIVHPPCPVIPLVQVQQQKKNETIRVPPICVCVCALNRSPVDSHLHFDSPIAAASCMFCVLSGKLRLHSAPPLPLPLLPFVSVTLSLSATHSLSLSLILLFICCVCLSFEERVAQSRRASSPFRVRPFYDFGLQHFSLFRGLPGRVGPAGSDY